MSETTTPARTYFNVALTMLEIGRELPCEIWVRRAGGEPVLYRGASQPFGESHRAKLLEAGIETVLVDFADAQRWHRYLEGGLRERINDGDRPLEERAQLLMDVARPLLREVLATPLAAESRGRVSELADSVCDLLRQPGALQTTVQLMEHDYYTYTHSLHVAIYSVALARQAGVDAPDVLAGISAGGLVHDCGKCRLPAHLINKPGRLEGAELELMREHPLHGLTLLGEIGWTDALIESICGDHHERLDGSGYPRGLAGKAVSEVARIAAIADAFDAMTTDRSYQSAMPGFGALKILREKGARTYDQSLTETFVRMLLSGRN